jgi:hypothetical protein
LAFGAFRSSLIPSSLPETPSPPLWMLGITLNRRAITTVKCCVEYIPASLLLRGNSRITQQTARQRFLPQTLGPVEDGGNFVSRCCAVHGEYYPFLCRCSAQPGFYLHSEWIMASFQSILLAGQATVSLPSSPRSAHVYSTSSVNITRQRPAVFYQFHACSCRTRAV